MRRIASVLVLLFAIGLAGNTSVTAQDEKLPFTIVTDSEFCTLLTTNIWVTTELDPLISDRQLESYNACIETLDSTIIPESLFPSHEDYMIVWATLQLEPEPEKDTHDDHAH